MSAAPRTRVCQLITRLIVGGAQEHALATALGLRSARFESRYESHLWTGPETGPEGSLHEEAVSSGLAPEIVDPLVRRIAPWSDARAFHRLVGGFRSEPGFDLVATHSSKAGVLGRVAARRAGVPVVVHTVHGWPFHDHQPAWLRRIYIETEKRTAPLADRLLVVSERDIEKGLQAGIGRREDYVLIRSGVDLAHYATPSVLPADTRASLGIPEDVPVVGTVTRLSPQKSPVDLARLFVELGRTEKMTWFLIVGDGPERAEVEAILAEGGIRDRSVLAGLRRDIPEMLSVLDVFVLTSLWEGLPRVLPQAMAAGVPIVCTDADGNREAVRDGEGGFLCPRGDIPQMAAKVSAILTDPVLRGRMREFGRRAAPEFSVESMVDQVESLYRELLDRARSSAGTS